MARDARLQEANGGQGAAAGRLGFAAPAVAGAGRAAPSSSLAPNGTQPLKGYRRVDSLRNDRCIAQLVSYKWDLRGKREAKKEKRSGGGGVRSRYQKVGEFS